MSGDMCRTIPLAGIHVQENGIIRDKEGWIIARLVKDVTFEMLLKEQAQAAKEACLAEHFNDSECLCGQHVSFRKARKLMLNAFNEDPDFERGYVDNIAMLLHDHYGITDMDERNQAGKAIMNLVFRST